MYGVNRGRKREWMFMLAPSTGECWNYFFLGQTNSYWFRSIHANLILTSSYHYTEVYA